MVKPKQRLRRRFSQACSPRRGERGATLAELAVACAVLGLVAVGFSGGSVGEARGVRRGFQETVALQAVEAVLEAARATAGTLRPGAREVPLREAERRALPGAVLRRAVAESEGAAGLLSVTATLWWYPGGAAEGHSRREVALTTLVRQGEAR